MLYDIMDTIEGMNFTLRHEQDGEYYSHQNIDIIVFCVV